MRILIIGATGGTGTQLARQALEQNHDEGREHYRSGSDWAACVAKAMTRPGKRPR